MGGRSDLEIISQMPFGVIAAPIVFGLLWIASMVLIARRYSERRRKERIARGEIAPTDEQSAGKPAFNWFGLIQRAPQLPEPEIDLLLRDVPGPDLSALAAGLTADIIEGEIVPVAPMSATAPSARTSIPQEIDPAMSTPTSDPGDAVEVMRVWRDLSDGSLIIQMGDQRYRTVEEIRNPDLMRRFTAVVRELWSMVSSGARITPLPEQPAAAPLAPANPPGTAVPRVGIINPTAQETAKKGRGKGKTEPEAPSGIVGAVEEFLQFKLSTTSEFAARSIHIRPSHDHGLRIEVDGHFYDSIDDVIDADVRDFLQNMMKEWEARH